MFENIFLCIVIHKYKDTLQMEKGYVESCVGIVEIEYQDNTIYSCVFINHPLPDNCKIQDIHYYEGYNVSMNGTPFQTLVWEEILNIPQGKTVTYSEIAEKIGKPNAHRAVANACGQNKIAIFIPCHRVVGKGNMGGYKWGIERKKKLLQVEKAS